MTFPTQLPPQSDPPLSPRLTLPTMYDLPSENLEEPGLPDEFHLFQAQMLDLTFQPLNWEVDLIFTGSDLNLYYDVSHLNWYKRPDWFAVVGVSRLYEGKDLRLSYVSWQEKVNPFVVVELLSPGTEAEDLGETVSQEGKPPTKWEVYEQILRIPYYIVFSRYTNELQVFRLNGGHYESVKFEGQFLIPELGLCLNLWQGSYKNISRLWVRWFTAEGELIPTPQETAEQEHIRAEQERIRAEQAEALLEAERQRTAQLLEQLREQGIDLDRLQ